MPDGVRPFHFVNLPETYDEFMKGFKSKQRFTLKKKIRRITEAFPGRVEFRRVSDTRDLAFLNSSVHHVLSKSWKEELNAAQGTLNRINNEPFLKNIASRGLLRSHVLIIDNIPCAFILGYLYNGIYHYADLAYDADFAKYAPGIVLLLMVIEDLINSDQAKHINFGIKDAQYKRVFGNCHVQDAALLIVRPSLANALRIGLHRAYRNSKMLAKRLLNRDY
jgi:CelD/BcsL family acetyltransferase involved in cellulose biosynthesis